MELFKHQIDALQAMQGKGNFALFFEQGLGKTLVALKDFERDTACDTLVVVVAPNGIQTTWEQQIQQAGLNIPTFIYAGENKTKKVAEHFEAVMSAPRAIFIFYIEMINPHFKSVQNFVRPVFERRKNINITIDQSQSIKNPTAKRSVFMTRLGLMPNVIRRRILEGAPNEEGQHELYSQFAFLNRKIIGEGSFISFKNKYCVLQQHKLSSGRQFTTIIGEKNQKVLMGLISPYTMWVKRDECLDLPDVIYKTIPITLSQEEQKVYQDFTTLNKLGVTPKELDDLATEYDIDNDNVLLAFVYMLRIHQASCGIFTQQKSKTEFLASLLEDEIPHKEQVIVFCSYRNEVDSVVETLTKKGISCVGYYGGDDRSKVNEFMNGNVRVIVATHRRLGVGFNLQFCNNVVFHSCLYSARQRKECIARVDRIGQTKHPVVYDLIAKSDNGKSIDTQILKMIKDKLSVSEMAYEIYKEYNS